MVAKNENKDSIISVTGLSRSTVYKVATFIEENEPNATSMPYYNKPGRKLTDNKGLINNIKDVITIDNSYTQIGIKIQVENINFSVSRSKICKVMKQADITLKRIKKKASITLSQDHQQSRSRYASLFLSKRDRTFLFLDESGFNLHTSINYGYSDKNVDAVLFVPPNRGINVSTCCCFNERTFTGRPIVVMDNVRFYKSREVLNLLNSLDIEYMFLPIYTPQFNAIEGFFSALKSNYHRIRPKPQTTPDLVITLANPLSAIQRENTIECVGFIDHMINFLNLAYSNLEFCYLI
ncbi:hypothetical protein HZS_5777 [Henneguya salminicola]|nr:hypothetical protein HZS_5777 [Henneguya salminicola]